MTDHEALLAVAAALDRGDVTEARQLIASHMEWKQKVLAAHEASKRPTAKIPDAR